MPGADSSVSDAATASSGERSRQKLTYPSTASRTPGSTPAPDEQLRPVEPGGLAEPQPPLDAALPVGPAVVLLDPPQPHTAQPRGAQLGQDQGVLDGDVPLVVEPVEDPAAQLVGGQLPLVHTYVEGMAVVVAVAGHGAQPFLEARRDTCASTCAGICAHSSITIPSPATSMPRSAEPLVLRCARIDEGIGVVQMGVETAGAKRRQALGGAARPVDREVSHTGRGAGGDTGAPGFVVVPERAVDDHAVGFGDSGPAGRPARRRARARRRLSLRWRDR